MSATKISNRRSRDSEIPILLPVRIQTVLTYTSAFTAAAGPQPERARVEPQPPSFRLGLIWSTLPPSERFSGYKHWTEPQITAFCKWDLKDSELAGSGRGRSHSAPGRPGHSPPAAPGRPQVPGRLGRSCNNSEVQQHPAARPAAASSYGPEYGT
jgi:hypothetical protein